MVDTHEKGGEWRGRGGGGRVMLERDKYLCIYHQSWLCQMSSVDAVLQKFLPPVLEQTLQRDCTCPNFSFPT